MNQEVIEQLLDWVRNRYFGKYRGTVTDNKDSTNRGRIKVSVPAVLGDLEVWALPCLPFAGKNMGAYMIPEPDAGVWVGFEGGDPSFPIWSGGFWANNELPKNEKSASSTPSRRIIKSSKGLMVGMDDKAKVITVSDEDGSNIITIEVQKGTIKIKGNTKVVVEAPQIELVENATHAVVFGDELMKYLNQLVQTFQSHMHPGQMAGNIPVAPTPPTPALSPPTPSLLSTKVKAG
ncbi:MAG TPA: phage baseplate assembly protein V [Saprospiraceae bacterium]|nr:phage baseplate assembly protein V [Saprospiraceae bacterium]